MCANEHTIELVSGDSYEVRLRRQINLSEQNPDRNRSSGISFTPIGATTRPATNLLYDNVRCRARSQTIGIETSLSSARRRLCFSGRLPWARGRGDTSLFAADGRGFRILEFRDSLACH